MGVLRGCDQPADAQDIELRRRLHRAAAGDLVRALLVGLRGLARAFADVEQNAHAGPIELITQLSRHLPLQDRIHVNQQLARDAIDLELLVVELGSGRDRVTWPVKGTRTRTRTRRRERSRSRSRPFTV
jgi:hypothetical protein